MLVIEKLGDQRKTLGKLPKEMDKVRAERNKHFSEPRLQEGDL